MAYNSWVLCFPRDRETFSSTCLVISVSPSGPLITWSLLGTSHLKAPRTENPSLWEVSLTSSLDEDNKALLAYLTLFIITSGAIPTGYAASFLVSRTHVEFMCVYNYIHQNETWKWQHTYFICRVNNQHVCFPFTLRELAVSVFHAITLYIRSLSYRCSLKESKLTSLLCCCYSSCGNRAHRFNTVSRAAHVWSPGPQPSDEQRQQPPPAAAAQPGPHGLRPTRTSLQPAGPGPAWTVWERTPKTQHPSPPKSPGNGELESTRWTPQPAQAFHGPSSSFWPTGEPFPSYTSSVWDAGTTKSKWFL